MNRMRINMLSCLATLLGFMHDGRADTGSEPSADPVVPADAVIAVIDGIDIPYDWFKHEFRSGFFRHAGEEDVRQAVFDDFMERMTLYALAKKKGVDQEPELADAIRSRVDGMRAFMEYQLAMTEVGMVVEAFLETLERKPEDFEATEEDVAALFRDQVSAMPGAPSSLDQVPEPIRKQLEARAAMEKYKAYVGETIRAWSEDLDVTVEDSLIQSVPMPDMKGHVPPMLRRPSAGPAVMPPVTTPSAP